MKDLKYFIKTYGCQMNVHESEKLAGSLISLGYTESQNMKDADLIIFNTCCIRDGVELKIYGNIGSVKNLKKQNPNLIVAVCGCMAQEKQTVETLKQKYPFVNIVFGTHNIHEFKDYITQYKEKNKNIYNVWDNEKEIFEQVDMYRTSNNNAWVNINFGCNNYCTYCIVPFVRGRERSRSMNEIIDEVKDLINMGYKQITLLGQNVNSYGNDIDDDNVNFANLLNKLANLEGDFKIKFMTSHPKDLTIDVIKQIAQNDKLAKVIHLPIQSGSNKILKSMNRNYTSEHYLSLIKMIRENIPNCYISTDIIVGFPGETEQDFQMTYDLVEKVRYDGVFAFMYSKRKGTVAESMPDQVDESVKNYRVNTLLKLSKEITKQKTKELIGNIYDVLIIEKNDSSYKTITDSGKTVYINDCDNLEINKYYKIKVVSTIKNSLVGQLV